MSYLGEIGLHSAARTAVHSGARVRACSLLHSGRRQRSKLKIDMNYEAIKARIETLVTEAADKPLARIDAALQPIRESLLEARRQGVRLRDLYDVVKTESKDISASSFAKYAQRHLQVTRQRRKSFATRHTSQQPKPSKHKDEMKIQESPEQPRTQAGKPRIAKGDY
jgi:predicted nucleotidyltransferase component of viral defense system